MPSDPSQQTTQPGKRVETGTEGKVAGPQEQALIYNINSTAATGLTIVGTIQDTVTTIVLDSGSDISIIDSHHPALRPQTATTNTSARIILKLDDGTELLATQTADLNIMLPSVATNHTFIIAPIADDCLLGFDFFRQYGCLFDFQTNTLTVDGLEIDMEFKNSNVSAYRIICAENIIIPPLSEGIIRCRLLNRHPAFKWGAIQGMSNCFGKKRGIWIARTVIATDNEQFPVRLFNSSSAPQTIRKDTLVALCEPTKMVRSVHQYQSSTSEASGDTPASSSEMPEHLTALSARATATLDALQTEEVSKILLEFQHFFSTGPLDLGRTTLVKHAIDTGVAHPVRQLPRRLPQAKRNIAEQEVKAMAEAGVIEPSSSPWASPIVLVSKRDGSYRYCIDYRKVNDLTNKDNYPLPRIDSKLLPSPEQHGFPRWTSSQATGRWRWKTATTKRLPLLPGRAFGNFV